MAVPRTTWLFRRNCSRNDAAQIRPVPETATKGGLSADFLGAGRIWGNHLRVAPVNRFRAVGVDGQPGGDVLGGESRQRRRLEIRNDSRTDAAGCGPRFSTATSQRARRARNCRPTTQATLRPANSGGIIATRSHTPELLLSERKARPPTRVEPQDERESPTAKWASRSRPMRVSDWRGRSVWVAER